MSLWFDAVEPGPGAVAAGAKLRRELLAASELSVKRVSHELNRGIHDLERVSRPPGKRKRKRPRRSSMPSPGVAAPE
jgi:hypothetical protein